MFLSFWSALFLTLHFFFSPLNLTPAQEEKTEQAKKKSEFHHEIVVTATRIETPLREVGNTLKVISGADLRQKGLTTLSEALAQFPQGFLLQNGWLGAAASLMLRGANSEHTLVLIDGVEVNDPISPARSFDFSSFLLVDIDRAEILEGPQSPLYGSDAMAGVVNIITRKSDSPRLYLFTQAGSFSTYQAGLAVAGRLNKLSYNLKGARLSTRGISAASSLYPGNKEADSYVNTTLSGRLNLNLAPRQELGLTFRLVKATTDLDNFGGPYGDDPNYAQDSQMAFCKLDYQFFFPTQLWEQKLALSFFHSRRENQNQSDDLHPFDSEEGHFQSRLLRFDWQNNLFLRPTNTLTWGLEAEQEEGESTYFWASLWGEDRSFFPRKKASSFGIYLQDHFQAHNFSFTTAGVRVDYHTRGGTSITYKLAESIWIKRISTKLRASVGTGFKAPSLYQLFAPETIWGPIGNPELKPERSFSLDVGLEQGLFQGKFFVSTTYFSSRFENLIQFDFARGYLNLGRAQTSGVRFETQTNPFAFLKVGLGFNWLRSQDKTTGEKLLRRPDHQAKVELELVPSQKGKLILSLVAVGRRDDIDYSSFPAQKVTLEAYNIINSTLLLDLAPSLSLYLRADNLTSERYEVIKGYGAPRRAFFAGFNWSF